MSENSGYVLLSGPLKKNFSYVACKLEVLNPSEGDHRKFEKRSPSFEFADGTFCFNCVVEDVESDGPLFKIHDNTFSCYMIQLTKKSKKAISYNVVLTDANDKEICKSNGSAVFGEKEERILYYRIDKRFNESSRFGNPRLDIQLFYSKPTNEDTCVQPPTIYKDDGVVNDFAKILESGEHSDFTAKVKNRKFRLHKSILAARNPYFSAMFKAGMKEKKKGIVSIDDCEPDIFGHFVHFVYTGKLPELSYENLYGLYEVADKYQQDPLREECVRFMKNTISVLNFCDILELALKHGNDDLLKNATEFFCKKTKEIVQTVKWQTFLREYPTQANELKIKAFDSHFK